ncbi:MAG TPA: class I lanthipeptide [Thermoanaerobaculia bacterium]|nr:class I lanthipeptide [Thermoanaerobaculia bacterium]
MKTQRAVVKKLKIDKETLLPLTSRQMNEVEAGAVAVSPVVHLNNSRMIHF